MAYRIPLFDLNVGRPEHKAVGEVLRSKWISMGEKTAEFEQAFARHLGVDHVVALTNCTAALHLAMILAGVRPGDEVIVPSLTFVATVNAVRYAGAAPVFADVRGLGDFTLDPEDVARKITQRTRAIVVMHYGGFPAQMGPILDLARHKGLRVIEDAAHAPDAEWEGHKLGTLGDVGCFSFFSNKNITCAEGGALATGDPAMAKRARLLRSHGMTTVSYERAKGHATSYDVVEVGYNYRLDDVRAAMLLAQLERLAADLRRRQALVQEYWWRLADAEELILPFYGFGGRASYYIMPVVLDPRRCKAGRDQVRRRLEDAGIQTSVHYPPVHRFKSYRGGGRLPVTDSAAAREITLPLYFGLRKSQVAAVCEELLEAVRSR